MKQIARKIVRDFVRGFGRMLVVCSGIELIGPIATLPERVKQLLKHEMGLILGLSTTAGITTAIIGSLKRSTQLLRARRKQHAQGVSQ